MITRDNFKNFLKHFWNFLKKIFFLSRKQKSILWESTNVDLSLYNEPHNCGLIALHELIPNLSINNLKKAFLFCCEKWPYDGVKKRDMNIVLRYLKLYDLMSYKDVSEDNFLLNELIKNTKKSYMVLVPNHYFVVKNGIVIDHDGEYYYRQRNKILVHCYWELIS